MVTWSIGPGGYSENLLVPLDFSLASQISPPTCAFPMWGFPNDAHIRPSILHLDPI